jgi:hypothetical protein
MRDLRLIIEYMNEHYAAARHHQTMRMQMLAIFSAAASLLFSRGVTGAAPARGILGITLLLIAALSSFLNHRFSKANRYHVEVAKRARDAISSELSSENKTDEISNPNVIGKAVRLMEAAGEGFSDKQYKEACDGELSVRSKKIEPQLVWALNALTILVAIGGLFLIVESYIPQIMLSACHLIARFNL